MTFPERSCAVAKSFLQSVVVFDDLARLEEPRLAQASDDPNQTPDTDPYGAAPGELTPPAETETLPSGEAGVDVKRLSDAFAEMGLICGFLKPKGKETEAEGRLLLGAARRADIVILDWVIQRDEGEMARSLVKELLQADKEQEEQRLRLIVVYTSQSNLDTIVEQLAETLEEAAGEALERGDYVLSAGAARVAVFAKETSAAIGDAGERRFSEEDLPDRLIEEFADFTSGLVPNVVLAGLAAVRTDTHRVLQVLDSRLDPAYVGQRLLLADPAGAEEQLVELVASELRSVMEDREIGAEADAGAVEEWVEWRLENCSCPTWSDVDLEQAKTESKALLNHGIASNEGTVADFRSRRGIRKGEIFTEAARVFADDAQAGDTANDELAMRFALRTHYSHPDRVLQLGTIVRSDAGYLLCVQPVCDSLRIDGERNFPFLPLVERTDEFDLVVKDSEGKRVTLGLERKPHQIRQLRFRSDPEKRCVVALPDERDYIFNDTAGVRYVWVARLQDAHGQRVVHALGSDFGRIGLSESEWLRKVSGAN